jgi:fatty-acyl-CoA synthase
VSPRTISALLRARAEQDPDAPGYFYREGAAWVSWSWRDYWENARRAGSGLRATGLGPGDHVLMLVTNVNDAVPTLFGVWAIGGVPVQVGAPYRLTDVAGFVRELRPTAQRLSAKALVVSSELAPLATEAVATLPVLSAGDLLGADAGTDLPDPELVHAPALIQLTSGSTGHPRGVVISHPRLLRHLAAISEALPLADEDAREVSWLPLHHDMGLIGGLLFPLFNGFPLYHLSPLEFRQNPFAWLEAISDAGGTCSPAPPSAYAIALRLASKAVEAGLDLRSWACAMVGAEPISADLLRRFAKAFGPCGFRAEAFFPVYGLAEATVAVTFPRLLEATRVDRIDRSVLEREARAVPSRDDAAAIELVGVGRPLPGTNLRVVREGKRAGPREVGEIWVRSSTLMEGYYDDPEATAEVMEDGWLKTGDLGYQADGSLFVTGRKKEVIIKGGHNLLPSAIEEIVGRVEGIRSGCVAAVGVRSQEQATEMVYVVAETKLDPVDHRELRKRVRTALRDAGIAVDQVVLVPPGGVPKTTSGKIRRAEVGRELEEELRRRVAPS